MIHDHPFLSVENPKLKEIRFRVSRYTSIGTNNFPGFLRHERLEKGLKQKELAKLLGVSKNKIYEWENGRGFPSEEYLKKISDILD